MNKLHILAIHAHGNDTSRRRPLLAALARLGHDVRMVDGRHNQQTYLKACRDNPVDVVLFWGHGLYNLLCTTETLFTEELGIPYVSIWQDNPLRYLHMLRQTMTPNHRALFVIDSAVTEQLRAIGFSQARYFPYCFADQRVFHPLSDASLNFDLVFAGAMDRLADVQQRRIIGMWTAHMQQLANNVLVERQQTRWYVDVYTMLAAQEPDIWSHQFMLMSNTLALEQKALEREQLLNALRGRELHVVGPLSYRPEHEGVVLHPPVEFNAMSQVFAAGRIHLCCTQWPRAAHERLFQGAATRSFVLSEYKEDVAELFEPGREAVMYRSLDELDGLIERYLRDTAGREKIATAAHRRFLAEHTAEKRMAQLATVLADLL